MSTAPDRQLNRRLLLGLAVVAPLAACQPSAGSGAGAAPSLGATSSSASGGSSTTSVSPVPTTASPTATQGSPTPTATPSPSETASATPGVFVHPGLLHTQADFDRMAAKVRANAAPWKAGWDRLVANRHSQSTWKANPLATVVRGGTGQNFTTLYNDIHASYQNALRWKITGDAANGDAARDILNAWSKTLTAVTGNADRFLAAGIYGYQFANAAEIMRGYGGFDFDRFKNMMLNVFYPLNEQFLTGHNDACITNYWANWDLSNMNSILAIGILCDDQAKVDRAVSYFKTGAGNGAIMNVIPFLHPDGLGQWQESGRDQGHTMMGVGQLGTFCEMAWNQGYDLFGYADNRFMRGAEYVARYNLGQSVPFTTYTWGTGQNCAQRSQTEISSASRGQDRPIWELVYNHYAVRKGWSVPNIAAYAARVRAEGGGGDYGPDSGGFDQLGFGTLTCTL
ncbi:MAG: alginate lyase family protein [Frankia sp.]